MTALKLLEAGRLLFYLSSATTDNKLTEPEKESLLYYHYASCCCQHIATSLISMSIFLFVAVSSPETIRCVVRIWSTICSMLFNPVIPVQNLQVVIISSHACVIKADIKLLSYDMIH